MMKYVIFPGQDLPFGGPWGLGEDAPISKNKFRL
jgi:hypothetical protein